MPQEILYNDYNDDDRCFVNNESSFLLFEYLSSIISSTQVLRWFWK